ncbi:MAG: RNA polymerase sigma-54 factor [Thermomicrobiales bacterium]|nr:RNA polymerase sigma-54 factor [Thermomicrobiales bacterium]
METGFDFSQEMHSWVSPSLIEANYILSLSRQELQQAVQAEMDANPALDVEDRATCPLCGNVLEGTFCPVCLVSQSNPADQPDRYGDMPEVMVDQIQTRDDSDDFDPLTLVAYAVDIRDQILRDARTLLDPRDYPIAEYLIDSIDERGLLGCDLDEVARLTERDRADIEAVVVVIQEVAPIGVGARTMEESLLLQLAYLEAGGLEPPPYIEEILTGHLTALGAHRFGQISRALGVPVEEVEAARDFIRTHLNPFPLQSQQARSWRTPSSAHYVAPDVVISIKDDELQVEVVDTSHFHLRLNPMYDRLAGEFGRHRSSTSANNKNGATAAGGPTANGAGGGSFVTGEDRDHVRTYASRAKLFIANIHQRRETLLKISKCICELQEPFLRGGVRDLRPLTRAVVAQQVGVHESTVSRATANKYVMLPTRKVIPFSDFFTPSLSVKDVIKELVLEEQRKGEQLTDRRICELLMQRGIRIARRTVAKYRAELGILPSTMR